MDEKRVIEISEQLYQIFLGGLMDSRLIARIARMKVESERMDIFYDPEVQTLIGLFYRPCAIVFLNASGEEIVDCLFRTIRDFAGEVDEENPIMVHFASKETFIRTEPRSNEVLVSVENISIWGMRDLKSQLEQYGYTVVDSTPFGR